MPQLPLNTIEPGMLPMPGQSGLSPERAAAGYASDLVGAASSVTNVIERQRLQQEAEAKAFAQRQQRDEAVLAVTKAAGSEHVASLQEFSDAQQQGSLAGFTDGWLKRFDQRTEEGAKAVPEAAQSLYRQHMAELRTNLNLDFFQKEVASRDMQLSTDAQGNIDNASKIAYVDPRQTPDQIAQQRAAIASLNLPQHEKQALYAKTEAIAYGGASAMAERNPAAFLARVSQAGDADKLKADPILSQLGSKNLETLTGHAQMLLKQQAAASDREMEKRLKEAQEAAQKLQNFTDTGGAPSLEYSAEVISKTAGTPFEEAARSMLKQAQQGAAFGSQSLPAQAAMLRGFQAQTALGSDPETQARLSRMETIHATQAKAYADNPWAAGTQFAKLPATPEMQITAPEGAVSLIAQRKPMMSTVETAAGGPVSPLQPGEAQAWNEQLGKLSVPQRADTLAAAGQQLNGGQINALADQIGKGGDPLAKATGLMLKVNDQTSAGRSLAVRIGFGAQAIADKTVKADETKLSGWRADIASKVRGTLGNTAAENDAIDAAYYIRASFELDAATAPGFDKSSTTTDNAVKLVLGQPIERAGVKTVLPKGMDEAAFDGKLRSFTPEQLKLQAPDGKVYMGGHEVPLEMFRSRIVDYGMRYAGPGVYVPVRGNTIITTDKQGTKPLQLKVQ